MTQSELEEAAIITAQAIGSGSESEYEQVLAYVLDQAGFTVERQVHVYRPVEVLGRTIRVICGRADLVVDGRIIVELKVEDDSGSWPTPDGVDRRAWREKQDKLRGERQSSWYGQVVRYKAAWEGDCAAYLVIFNGRLVEVHDV